MAVTNERPSIDALFVLLDVVLMLENSAVFQTQVGDQLIALSDAGLRTGLVAVSRDPALFDAVIGDKLRTAGVHIVLVKAGSFGLSLVRMVRAVRRTRRSFHVGRAYVRGIWGALVLWLAHPFDATSYVYDVRGDLADEGAAVGGGDIKRRIYRSLERRSIRAATHVCAVATPLADAIRSAHHRDVVTVVPSCVRLADMRVSAECIDTRRREMGVDRNTIVLTYCGGLDHYQQVPATLAIWRALRDEPDVEFLLVTNDDPQDAAAVIGDLSDFGPRLRRQSVPRADVPATLASADIGFMLRDGRKLNRAASPVKFGEYLAAGLAVVASPGTGDASGLVEQHRVGVLVDPADVDAGARRIRGLLAEFRRDREAIRRRALELAAARYDWRAYDRVFLELYRRAEGP